MKGFVFLLTLAGLGWEKESSNGGDEGNEKNYDNVILNASIICLMSSIYAFSPPGGLLEWRTGKSQQNSVEKQREEEKFVFVFTSNRTHAVKHIVSDISLAPWYWKKLPRWKKRFSFAFIYALFDFLPFSLRKPEIWSNMSCWHRRVRMYVGIETPIKIMLSTPNSSAYTMFCRPYLHDLFVRFPFLVNHKCE